MAPYFPKWQDYNYERRWKSDMSLEGRKIWETKSCFVLVNRKFHVSAMSKGNGSHVELD